MRLNRVLVICLLGALTLDSSAQGVKFKVLHNFGSSNDGSVPSGPLLLDSHGNLYGVTTGGGQNKSTNGTVYELQLQPNGGRGEKILYTFTAGSDGAYPWGALLTPSKGKLYGTIEGYGSYAVGGVFELSQGASGWSSSLLYSDGAGPGLLLDELGNFYGQMGLGKYSQGTVGELSPASGGWTYADLYDFCSTYCPDGYALEAPPVWDSNGNLWGATFEGGIRVSPCVFPNGCGVIFEMTPNGDGTWTYNVMHQFASFSTDGQGPYGGLVMDTAGNFYGGTLGGGAYGNGTIFKFTNVGGTWQEATLYDFPNCRQGCYVEGTLAIDSAGNLYGTASGGTNSCAGYACGVVFKLAPQSDGTWKYTTLYNFSETSGGAEPFFGVILDSKGNLYGVTSNFGKYEFGTAFELTP